jgi:hypothetical protein
MAKWTRIEPESCVPEELRGSRLGVKKGNIFKEK